MKRIIDNNMKDFPPHTRYRIMCGKLDEIGIVIYINRIQKKHYELQVNGEIIKQFKKRESCNKRIIKLFNQHINNIS